MLWLELKKLALAGIRLAAGMFLVLAMLNLGLGAAAVVAVPIYNSADSPITPGQIDTGQLLHLQFFGFWHVHESLDQAESRGVPGVTEYDGGLVPSLPVRFSYLNHDSHLDSDYSNGAVQKALTDFTDPHHLAGIAALSPLARHPLTDDLPVPNPFLENPLKPPIF